MTTGARSAAIAIAFYMTSPSHCCAFPGVSADTAATGLQWEITRNRQTSRCTMRQASGAYLSVFICQSRPVSLLFSAVLSSTECSDHLMTRGALFSLWLKIISSFAALAEICFHWYVLLGWEIVPLQQVYIGQGCPKFSYSCNLWHFLTVTHLMATVVFVIYNFYFSIIYLNHLKSLCMPCDMTTHHTPPSGSLSRRLVATWFLSEDWHLVSIKWKTCIEQIVQAGGATAHIYLEYRRVLVIVKGNLKTVKSDV